MTASREPSFSIDVIRETGCGQERSYCFKTTAKSNQPTQFAEFDAMQKTADINRSTVKKIHEHESS